MIQNKQTIVPVPEPFSFADRHLYPSDNFPDAEYWLSKNIKPEEIDGDRMYLPITWTGFYKTADYGKNLQVLGLLQKYLDSLDRSKKYFSITQWDDGILNKVDHLDLKVFSMSGNPMDYVLPLTCRPHILGTPVQQRNIFASFVGRITHPMRIKMINYLPTGSRYHVSTNNHSLRDYCDILAKSVFSLCPRGYGPTSFKLAESIQMGSIPVVISDNLLEPHGVNINTYGVKIEAKDVRRIDEILLAITPDSIRVKQAMLKDIYDTYFSFEGCKKLILANL